MFWEHAHNDYAELLAEMGIIGVILMGSTLILIMGFTVRNVGLSQPPILILLSGPGLVAIHAYVDFPMHNPAILVTGGCIIGLSLRWAELSRR